MTKIELTEQELQALVGLLDAGVRAAGLRGVKDAAALIAKIEAAAADPKDDDNVVEMERSKAADV